MSVLNYVSSKYDQNQQAITTLTNQRQTTQQRAMWIAPFVLGMDRAQAKVSLPQQTLFLIAMVALQRTSSSTENSINFRSRIC